MKQFQKLNNQLDSIRESNTPTPFITCESVMTTTQREIESVKSASMRIQNKDLPMGVDHLEGSKTQLEDQLKVSFPS